MYTPIIDYQGPRTAPGMVEYALGRLSDKIVLKVDDEPGVETLLKQGKVCAVASKSYLLSE